MKILVRPEVVEAVNEVVTISAPRFTLPLPIDAPGIAVKSDIASPFVRPAAPTAEVTPVVVPPAVTQATSLPAAEAAATSVAQSNTKVTAERLGPERWALRWVAEKPAPSSYRFDERELALNPQDELVVTWRQLLVTKISPISDPVSAELDHLPARQLHMIRVHALGADGATLWEAPLVTLPPERQAADEHNFWLPLLGLFLAGFLFLRWRAGRVSA